MTELQGNRMLRCVGSSYVDNVDNKHPINRQGKTPLDAARERFEWHDERLQELEKLWLHEEDQ